MSALATELRNRLERVVINARDVAEVGAREALQTLAVAHDEPYPHMKPAERILRNELRARARQLGDRKLSRPDIDGRDHEIDHLVGECAYEYWHRMLFARFLAENNLLFEPGEKVAISLAEAEELAKDDGIDVWVFASRCAQRMLPQIFRPDDPLLQFSFATEHMLKLESLLASLSPEVFTASDALGWVYQFWQSKKKDEVNRSQNKIGADELPAVTQLFTEPYIVEFLLHNTLGAWWAAKRIATQSGPEAANEFELRRKVAVPGVDWEYLRFVRADEQGGRWRPAAGTFDGWPRRAAELTVLDPCCGSGHFLVVALHLLVPIRMLEESLSAAEAVDAVLRENLHGLEIDERCCQIAAFALALAAWNYPGAGGYRRLPELNVAQTGIAVGSTREQWLSILEGPGNIGRHFFFGQLYDLFRKAPTIGSLINPHRFLGSGMLNRDGMDTLMRHLEIAIADDPSANVEKHELGIAAQGLARAAKLLADRYTLVVTNVPYLGRSKQDNILKEHLESQYPMGKADLATAFIQRCLEFCAKGGSVASVTPQNWLFLATFSRLREVLLDRQEWNIVVRLGPGAFETISGHVVSVALIVLSSRQVADDHAMAGIDVSAAKEPSEKAMLLRGGLGAELVLVSHAAQLSNPNSRVHFESTSDSRTLKEVCKVYEGTGRGDTERFDRGFWEFGDIDLRVWRPFVNAPENTSLFAGRELVFKWEGGEGELTSTSSVRIRGTAAWGKDAVFVSRAGRIRVTLTSGEVHAQNGVAVVPNDHLQLAAVWAYCSSPTYAVEVQKISGKVIAPSSALWGVPFDLPHWQKVAAQQFPDGLPEPETDDPTQYVFHGRPEESAAPLQVAVARLLGYRWPAELDNNMRLSNRARSLVHRCKDLASYATDSGIVCIPSVRGEEPASDRLLALLTNAGINPITLRDLTVGYDLDEWFRNRFFEEHCKLFRDRPFVWHIWDGRKRDGFHALVNYHKLCQTGGGGRKMLESLTYSYLGEWIARQNDGIKRGEGGAEDRLVAAVGLQNSLKSILKGEPPFDLFIRWKPLAEQPIGWEPDINDGVRMNIRPFLVSDIPIVRSNSGVLRWRPNIKWDKDRGKEPKRPIREFPWFWGWDGSENYAGGSLAEFTGERWNDCHYTNDFKRQSRQQAADRR